MGLQRLGSPLGSRSRVRVSVSGPGLRRVKARVVGDERIARDDL